MFLKLATSITNHYNRLPEMNQVAARVQSIGELCSSALTLELLTYRPLRRTVGFFPSHLTHACYTFASSAAQQSSRQTVL